MEAPNFGEKIRTIKNELQNTNFLISEEAYIEYRAKPEERRSFKEFILVKVYETVSMYAKELEKQRRENQDMSQESLVLKSKLDKALREVDSYKNLSRERDEDARRRIEALERKNKDLEGDLHRLNSQYKVIQEKGNQQNKFDEAYRQLEVDFKTQRN